MREGDALDTPVILLARWRDDPVIFADEGSCPQPEGRWLRQKMRLILILREGTDKLIIERSRRA